jgi:hypothetical protein
MQEMSTSHEIEPMAMPQVEKVRNSAENSALAARPSRDIPPTSCLVPSAAAATPPTRPSPGACRRQVKDGTGRDTFNVARVLAMSRDRAQSNPTPFPVAKEPLNG